MTPHANPRAAWPSNDDQTLFNLIVIVFGLGVGGYLLWTNFHGAISAGVMALRHQEMVLLGHFTGEFRLADQQMEHANPYRVTLRDLYGISHAIGRDRRIPGCACIAVLALVCIVRAAPSQFKRAFDLNSLTKEQAKMFPSSPVSVYGKLRLVPPAKGEPRPADYALTAEEWIGRYATDAGGVFDESRARMALRRQLGPRWAGPETTSPAAKVLFVAFALHLNERRQDAAELLGLVSSRLSTAEAGRPEGPATQLDIPPEIVTDATALAKDPDVFKEARDVAASHAYTTPALMSLLNAARCRHGVLAPAQFAWLKLVDRPLWYALHSLGFETEGIGRYLHPNPRVEALGARDHWAVECVAGEPLFEPDIGRALAALRRHTRPRAPVPARGGRPGVGAPSGGDPVRSETAQAEAPQPEKETTP